MPSKSLKQLNFMKAIANNKEFADKVGVKQEIGKEFVKETPKNKFKKLRSKLEIKGDN